MEAILQFFVKTKHIKKKFARSVCNLPFVLSVNLSARAPNYDTGQTLCHGMYGMSLCHVWPTKSLHFSFLSAKTFIYFLIMLLSLLDFINALARFLQSFGVIAQ